MSRRRRRRQREQSDVELNMASMLDMAFQLLTFFILTFKPAPVEGQISLRLPPPAPITQGTVKAGSDTASTDIARGMKTLTISVFAGPSGEIGALGVGVGTLDAGEGSVPDLPTLEKRLQYIFGPENPGNSFEQVIVQVGGKVRYDALMKVVDICTRLKLPNGQRLSKLSFVEVPGG
jgi:biopolymer transport protein ExbD